MSVTHPETNSAAGTRPPLSKSPNIKIQLIALLAAAALGTSCAIQQRLTYTESSARNIEPRVGAVITPIIADQELLSEEKIAPYELTVPGSITPMLIANLDGWKKVALNQAAQKYRADAIIGALINVRTEDNRLVISVTGWPVRYVNFRSATSGDAWIAPLYQVIGSDNEAFIQSNSKH